MTAAPALRANQVTRVLRAGGLVVLPSGTPRTREGIRVSGAADSPSTWVTVTVDMDSTRDALAVAAEARRILTAKGYAVTENPHDAAILAVTRQAEEPAPAQAESRQARCQECGDLHPAEFSHDGANGQGPIYAVVCTRDDLTDYYTEEGLEAPAEPAPAPDEPAAPGFRPVGTDLYEVVVNGAARGRVLLTETGTWTAYDTHGTRRVTGLGSRYQAAVQLLVWQDAAAERARREAAQELAAEEAVLEEWADPAMSNAPAYPPLTVEECVAALEQGLSLIAEGGAYMQRVEGPHRQHLGTIRCVTDAEGPGTGVRFAAYRPDGSRAFVPARTRVSAALQLLRAPDLTPATVTLTNPDLWS